MPSSSRSRSLQAIISEDQRKSLRNMISLSFAPIQAKVVVAGFENVLKIVERGSNINVFLQFAGPTIMRLCHLPLKGV